MKRYILPEHVLSGLLGYLENRPYKEVAQGIRLLTSLEEVKEPSEPEDASAKPPAKGRRAPK